MNMKSGLVGRFGALVLVVAMASIAFSIPNLTATVRPAFPFVGMSMVYYGVDSGEGGVGSNGNTEIRTISVLRYDADNNHVIIRDSQDVFDVTVVDLRTREVESTTGWDWAFTKPYYVEYWIPTYVRLGSQVKILNYDAIVTGSTKMCVDGRVIDVWQLQASGVYRDTTYPMQDTWYYDQRTGLLVAAAWIVYAGDAVVYNLGGHLVSTNAVLGFTQTN